MIKLSNGCILEYLASSGSLSYDGTGWWFKKFLNWLVKPKLFIAVSKTVTRFKKRGNFRGWNLFSCLKFLRDWDGWFNFIGVVNAFGLGNPGIEWLFKKVGPKIKKERRKLIISVYFESQKEMLEMVAILNAMDLVAVEVNIGCPNIARALYWQCPEAILRNCRELKKVLRHPIILKISVQEEVNWLLPHLEGVVEAISINSVPWELIFRKSPLAKFGGGGVSGKITQGIVWPFISQVAHAGSIPVIGSAVWDFKDLEKVRQFGASAVAFGSVSMLYPWRPASFVKKEM